jgi:hypothetical protein
MGGLSNHLDVVFEVEHRVEAGAGVLVRDLLRFQAEPDHYGIPIHAPVGLHQMMQGNREQPANCRSWVQVNVGQELGLALLVVVA